MIKNGDLVLEKKILPASRFSKLLLAWFGHSGRHDLPWQHHKNPYRVWVSEIMLQQTQVLTAISYFTRFIARFPDVFTLAAAPLDDVLHHWTGLGYYNRAKNLHKAAKEILHSYYGQLPADRNSLEALPGIGRTTAGAILSIAFNKRAPILDGNVRRVLSRIYGLQDASENVLWEIAESCTPERQVADYTQAIMDFGATFCVRGQPRCEACPFKTHCIAHIKGIEKAIPAPKTRKPLKSRTATFLVIRFGDCVLLEKRAQKGVWQGLFSVPEMPGKVGTVAIKRFCRERWGVEVKALTRGEGFRHTFSHYHLDILPVFVEVSGTREGEGLLWYDVRKPAVVGLAKPVKGLIESVSIL